jgi:hypothetical protein
VLGVERIREASSLLMSLLLMLILAEVVDSQQKRGFITVDVAPSDEHTDGHEWGRVRRGTEDGSGGAAPRGGASAR